MSHYIKSLLHQVTQNKLILHDLIQIQMENLEHTNGLNTLENQVEDNPKDFWSFGNAITIQLRNVDCFVSDHTEA